MKSAVKSLIGEPAGWKKRGGGRRLGRTWRLAQSAEENGERNLVQGRRAEWNGEWEGQQVGNDRLQTASIIADSDVLSAAPEEGAVRAWTHSLPD